MPQVVHMGEHSITSMFPYKFRFTGASTIPKFKGMSESASHSLETARSYKAPVWHGVVLSTIREEGQGPD